MRIPKGLLWPILAFALAGCASYTLVPPQRIVVAGMSVEPSVEWNARGEQNSTVWTIDGLYLQTIVFFSANDGNLITHNPDRSASSNALRFHKKMTEVEIMDAILAGITIANKNISPTPTSLKPYDFLGGQGMRFEYDLVTEEGLKKKGMVVCRVVGNRLAGIVYEGDSYYHYGKTLAEAERIVKSAKLAGAISDGE